MQSRGEIDIINVRVYINPKSVKIRNCSLKPVIYVKGHSLKTCFYSFYQVFTQMLMSIYYMIYIRKRFPTITQLVFFYNIPISSFRLFH